MDGSHFDSLVKTLAITPLSRTNLLRGLAASAAALAGLMLAGEPGTARKKESTRTSARSVSVARTGRWAAAAPRRVKADNVKKLLRRNPCATKGKCQGRNPCATQTPGTQTLSGCTPNCDRKVCGDDGCGGRCGTCGGGSGLCQWPVCVELSRWAEGLRRATASRTISAARVSDCPASSPDLLWWGVCQRPATDDIRNCGTCGTRCAVNEHVRYDGACRCGANGPQGLPSGGQPAAKPG